MEANQASLSTAEGLRIRGFARQAAVTASTGQRNQNQERNCISPARKETGVRVN